MAGYVAQPFFMQLVLQQIATQVVHKIANCDLKLLLHSTLREFSAGALVYSRPFPLRQSHTKVMKTQVPIIIIVITTSLFTGRIRT